MSSLRKTAARPSSPVRGVHVDVRGETRSQGVITRTRLGYSNAHWNTLHDLGEVPRRVVGREKRELCSGCAADARHPSFTDAAAVGVDLELHGLAGPNGGELRLLEVRSHPDPGIGDDAQERLAGCDELSDFDLFSGCLT